MSNAPSKSSFFDQTEVSFDRSALSYPTATYLTTICFELTAFMPGFTGLTLPEVGGAQNSVNLT